MGMLRHDWAASALSGLSVLTAKLLRGQSTNEKIYILFTILSFFFSWTMQEDYAGYDFENRLHVRIHSALASMRAAAQP